MALKLIVISMNENMSMFFRFILFVLVFSLDNYKVDSINISSCFFTIVQNKRDYVQLAVYGSIHRSPCDKVKEEAKTVESTSASQ